MRRNDKYAFLYLFALMPLSIVAMVWAISGLPTERVDLELIVFSLIFVSGAAQLRIQLPKTNLHLSLADAIVFFSLVYFGGELAVILSAAAALASAVAEDRESQMSVVGWLINVCISTTTLFVTSIVVFTVFGTPQTIIAGRAEASFVLFVVTLAFLPFLLNVLLTSVYLAIRGEKPYWRSLKAYSADALLVYLGAAIMAGLAVRALRETNAFLFFAVLGFFAILQMAFRRYRTDYNQSREEVAKSERERAKLTEKHIAEFKHYINELEKKSLALRESRERYRRVAYHDVLTGLPNRNNFVEAIDRLLSAGRDSQGHFALLYLDLHRFKTINDSLGHAIGDQLLSNVASRLINLVGPDDLVGRFNGDEFAILLPAKSDVEQAESFADLVAETLSQPFTLGNQQVFTGVSIGIVLGCKTEYRRAGEVLRDADIAMYRAKERNHPYVIFEKKMHVQAVSKLQLETDLRMAVERHEFEVFYQPIVELETTKFCGVEALVRWNHPQFGRISPDRFIEVSEATGLIIPMTLQILESACLQINEWNKIDGAGSLFVSVNLSGKHFTHPDLVEHIDSILAKTGVNPKCVKLEITETAVMDNAERAATVLQQIKNLGVQLSIDDFGTGYSSLSYLQRFPIDTLKIDRAFVRSMEDGRQNGEIVRAILALANAMNLSVIAEGIESVHQLHQLRILDCRYGQGYLFSHPLPAGETVKLIRNPHRWENLVSGSNFSIVSPSFDAAEERVH